MSALKKPEEEKIGTETKSNQEQANQLQGVKGHTYLVSKTPLIVTIHSVYGQSISAVLHPMFDQKLIEFINKHDFEIGTDLTVKLKKENKNESNSI